MQFQKGHKDTVGEKNAMYGTKRPDYVREAISESNKQRIWTEEMRKRVSTRMRGVKQSPEQIARRIKKGEENSLWKGEAISYKGVHTWIGRQLGKPTKCVGCGKDGLTSHKIHWSNISGEYRRDLSDWQRLCVPCHKRFDNERLQRGK